MLMLAFLVTSYLGFLRSASFMVYRRDGGELVASQIVYCVCNCQDIRATPPTLSLPLAKLELSDILIVCVKYY